MQKAGDTFRCSGLPVGGLSVLRAVSAQMVFSHSTVALIPEASPHKRRLKCDTKHQFQEADATFITSDGSKPYKPWRTLDTDNDNN